MADSLGAQSFTSPSIPRDAETLPAPPPYPSAAPPAQPARRLRTWPALLALLFFAAILPESIETFNTTPVRMVTDPSALPFLMAFYGSADVLVRELLRRRPLRWGAVLLLGIAFGFVNEGIIANTWYSVTPKGYALINGVDWAWAAALTLFHTVFSVVVPILFVELLFPRLANRAWLGRKAVVAFALLFVLVSSLGIVNSKARQYLLYKPLVVLAIVALVVVALLLPRAKPRALRPAAAPRLWTLRVAGFAGMLAFFLVIFLVPASLAPRLADPGRVQIIAIAADLAAFLAGLAVVRRWSGRSGWSQRHSFALLAGVIALSVPLSLLQQDALAGLSFAFTLPCFALVIYQSRRLARQAVTQQTATTPAI
jgi:hypothetical protein